MPPAAAVCVADEAKYGEFRSYPHKERVGAFMAPLPAHGVLEEGK